MVFFALPEGFPDTPLIWPKLGFTHDPGRGEGG